MTLRTLIADDEPLARELLASWVHQDARLRLVGQAEDGDEVLKVLSRHRIDLLFLDIQMPHVDGLETLKAIRSRGLKTYVVFVTAFSQHAVTAFDLAAGDYLVKPLRKARFAESVSRARRVLEQQTHFDASCDTLKPLMVRDGDRMMAVSTGSIVWVEAASQYARVHTGKAQYLLSRPLAEIESELPDQYFVRVHRSALVNLGCVRHLVRKKGNYRLELSNGAIVPVARSRRVLVMDLLRKTAASTHVPV